MLKAGEDKYTCCLAHLFHPTNIVRSSFRTPTFITVLPLKTKTS
jgi:hypothetical protein